VPPTCQLLAGTTRTIRPVPNEPELEISPLTPDRLADLAALFGQGGDPRWCWCSYHRGGSTARRRDDRIATNRSVLEDATRSAAAQGRAAGLIAYQDGDAVGWVAMAPRDELHALDRSTVLRRVDDQPVWSITCFVVGKAHRGQGIAAALLDAAIAYAAEHGATQLEAYPVDTGGGRIQAAYAYRGPLSMFERAGFEVVDRRQFNARSPVWPIVRRRL
jgi:GNAT superfamily N-acetyltransferase